MNKLVASLLALASLIGTAFAVDNFYMRRAEAKEQAAQLASDMLQTQRDLSTQQERDRIENELKVIRLELEFLSAQYEDVRLSDGAREKLRERKQYLRKREEILEARLLTLGDAP